MRSATHSPCPDRSRGSTRRSRRWCRRLNAPTTFRQERYKAGRDSFLNVLDSQRSYYSAQQGLIAVRLAEQNNRVSLYTALGGGWRERSE